MPPIMRKFFWFLNKFFMVPLFRLGLGPLFVNPFGGYIMVMKTIGRKSGKVRYAPVNYAIYQGDVYCISGGRKSSDWYRNLLATPDIEVILPGGAIYGHVEEIQQDAALRLVVIRQILQNAGFAGFFEGYNPYRIGDEELAAKSADLPLLRIRPTGLGNGAADPAGWAWLFATAVSLAIIWAVLF
ncbi:MAG: nitroreductase/quinone reductase family protein [Chloroflexota bacterium]